MKQHIKILPESSASLDIIKNFLVKGYIIDFILYLPTSKSILIIYTIEMLQKSNEIDTNSYLKNEL